MPIIFGWGKQTLKEFGTLGESYCQRCHNGTHRRLVLRRIWFTLFFIPIIPYRTEYLVVCPICNGGTLLDKEEFEILRNTIPVGQGV